MYDAFSDDYDRFVNWPGRLAFELPWIERHLEEVAAVRVLDAACGTGMHAIALAQRGYQAAGADLSGGMIDRARHNAAEAGVAVQFVQAGFGELAVAFGLAPKSGYAQPTTQNPLSPTSGYAQPAPPFEHFPQDGYAQPTAAAPENPAFDALLCLGNSLPHLLTPANLAAALADFAACLRPGGLLIIQSRNFDAVLASQARWMEPQAHQQGQDERLFVRFYDFRPDGLIDFNILTLKRQSGKSWEQRVTTTTLFPQRQVELVEALKVADFSAVESYGGLDGSPFDPASSGNLVLLARKTAG